MAKKIFFCYGCESEFSISTKSNEPILYCPFCAADLEEADKDDDHEEE